MKYGILLLALVGESDLYHTIGSPTFQSDDNEIQCRSEHSRLAETANHNEDLQA